MKEQRFRKVVEWQISASEKKEYKAMLIIAILFIISSLSKDFGLIVGLLLIFTIILFYLLSRKVYWVKEK